MSLIKGSVCPFEKQELVCKICEDTNGAMESMFCDENDEQLLSKIFKCTKVTVKPVCGIISPICEFCRSRIDQFDETFQPRCQEYVLEKVTSCTAPDDDPFNCIDPMDVHENDTEAKESCVDDDMFEIKQETVQEISLPNILRKGQTKKSKSNEAIPPKREDSGSPSETDNEDPDENVADFKAESDDDSQDYDNTELVEIDETSTTKRKRGRRKVETPLSTIKKPSKCEICGKVVTYMKYHMRIHSGEKKYQCPQCDRSFSQSNNLLYHVRTHTGEKPFACDKCDKSFICKSHLISHARLHINDQPFQCEFCSKRFNQACNLTKHRRVHTGEKPYKCGMCEKAFMNLSNMKTHEKRHRGERNFTCEICSKSFYVNHHLERHKATHTKTKQHKCSVCSKEFSTAAKLQSHTANHENSLISATCEVCKKNFSCERKLRIHLKYHNSKKYLQKVKKSNASRESSDRIDQPDLHTDSNVVKRTRSLIFDPDTATKQLADGLTKPYRCAVCFRLFNQASNLKIHLKLHMFKKVFRCTQCSQTFDKHEEMRTHACIHSYAKPFPGRNVYSKSVRKSSVTVKMEPSADMCTDNGFQFVECSSFEPDATLTVAKLEDETS